jgi:hypothetical protein
MKDVATFVTLLEWKCCGVMKYQNQKRGDKRNYCSFVACDIRWQTFAKRKTCAEYTLGLKAARSLAGYLFQYISLFSASASSHHLFLI